MRRPAFTATGAAADPRRRRIAAAREQRQESGEKRCLHALASPEKRADSTVILCRIPRATSRHDDRRGTRLGPFRDPLSHWAPEAWERSIGRATRGSGAMSRSRCSRPSSRPMSTGESASSRRRASASALNHSNIVTIHDIGTQGETVYIAMEFVDGRTLREVLGAGALPTRAPARPELPARGRPRQGARGRDRPPGPQARKRDGHEGRGPQDPRLRPRQAPQGATGPGHQRPDRAGDSGRHGDGHRRVHVAGAGQRPPARLSHRPVLDGLDPVRDGDGQARLPARNAGRDSDGHHPRGHRAGRAAQRQRARLPFAGSSSAASRRIPRNATRRRATSRATCAPFESTCPRPTSRAWSPERRRPRRCGPGGAGCPPLVVAAGLAAAFAAGCRDRHGASRALSLRPTSRSPSAAARSVRRASLPTVRRSSTARRGTAARSSSS